MQARMVDLPAMGSPTSCFDRSSSGFRPVIIKMQWIIDQVDLRLDHGLNARLQSRVLMHTVRIAICATSTRIVRLAKIQ